LTSVAFQASDGSLALLLLHFHHLTSGQGAGAANVDQP